MTLVLADTFRADDPPKGRPAERAPTEAETKEARRLMGHAEPESPGSGPAV